METFLQTYGYWAILIGTFLEGETILVLGGLAAHMGYMDLTGVILTAFAGSLCGDQLFFLPGPPAQRVSAEPAAGMEVQTKARQPPDRSLPDTVDSRIPFPLRIADGHALCHRHQHGAGIAVYSSQCHRRDCLGWYR